MGMFVTRMPRGFHHTYIYADERKERLERLKEKARHDPEHPPSTGCPPEASKEKRVQYATRLRRRKEGKRQSMKPGTAIIVIAVLLYLWYAIS